MCKNVQKGYVYDFIGFVICSYDFSRGFLLLKSSRILDLDFGARNDWEHSVDMHLLSEGRISVRFFGLLGADSCAEEWDERKGERRKGSGGLWGKEIYKIQFRKIEANI